MRKRGTPHTTLKLPIGMCFIAIHNAGDSEVHYLLSAIIFVRTVAAFICVLVNSVFFGTQVIQPKMFIMNWEGDGSDLLLRHLPSICLKGLRKIKTHKLA